MSERTDFKALALELAYLTYDYFEGNGHTAKTKAETRDRILRMVNELRAKLVDK